MKEMTKTRPYLPENSPEITDKLTKQIILQLSDRDTLQWKMQFREKFKSRKPAF